MNRKVVGWLIWGTLSVMTGVGGYFLGYYLKEKSREASYEAGMRAGEKRAREEGLPKFKEAAANLKAVVGGLQSKEFAAYIENLDVENMSIEDIDEFIEMSKLEEETQDKLK